MTIQIKLKYNGDLYLSSEREVDEDSLQKLRDILVQISKSKVDHLIIENGTEQYYFNKSILEKSIITLISN
jgi:hypothetical protein